MEYLPGYVWPLVSLFCSGLGAWVGVKVSVTRLEVEMKQALTSLHRLDREVALHGEDLQAHDLEIGQALDTLKLKRARRQKLRGYEP